MYCTQCGNKLRDGVAFCPSCGARVHLDDQIDSAVQGGERTTAYAPVNPAPSGADAVRREIATTRRKAPIVIRALIIVCFLVIPWFDVNYLFGSSGFNFLSGGELLSQGASLASSLETFSGTSSSTSGMVGGIAGLAFLMAAVPIALLGYDIYRYWKHGVAHMLGYAVAIVCFGIGTLVVLSINDALGSYVANSFGGASIGEVVTIGAGWWLTVVLICTGPLFDGKVDFNQLKKEGE